MRKAQFRLLVNVVDCWQPVSSQIDKHKQENDPLHPVYMSKIHPERHSNQDTASSTLLNPLTAAPILEDWPSGPAISRQQHTSSPSASMKRYLEVRVRHGQITSGQGLGDATPLYRNGDTTSMDMQRVNVGMNWQWNNCWSVQSCHNPVPTKTWKSSTPSLFDLTNQWTCREKPHMY